jgi:hypothetical protein
MRRFPTRRVRSMTLWASVRGGVVVSRHVAKVHSSSCGRRGLAAMCHARTPGARTPTATAQSSPRGVAPTGVGLPVGVLVCRSRRTVAWSRPVSLTMSAAESRSPTSRSTAAAAVVSAASTARSAAARASHATSTSTVASSMRLSRASWSGSSWRRRSRAAFSRLSRARSRPACACPAVLTGDHLFLHRLPRPHDGASFTSQKQPPPPQIGHPEPDLLDQTAPRADAHPPPPRATTSRTPSPTSYLMHCRARWPGRCPKPVGRGCLSPL